MTGFSFQIFLEQAQDLLQSMPTMAGVPVGGGMKTGKVVPEAANSCTSQDGAVKELWLEGKDLGCNQMCAKARMLLHSLSRFSG